MYYRKRTKGQQSLVENKRSSNRQDRQDHSEHQKPHKRKPKLHIMLLVLLVGLYTEFALGYRGPHHPTSSIAHHHHAPQREVKLTQDVNLLQDATHLKEDMGPLADQLDLSKMSDEELEFYYFKVHDVDNNTKLDGLEILHALQHTLHVDEDEREHYESHKHGSEGSEEKREELPFIVELIDRVLEEDDLNNDGYLGYIEYVIGRERDQEETAKRNKKLKLKK